jgi:hypothetical protein
LKFQLTADDRHLRDELVAMLKDIQENRPLITTDGYFTDRIEIRNLRSREDRGVGFLESMYLGAPLADLFYPFSPIFWSGFDTSFSALVLKASSSGLTVKLFNHSSAVQNGKLSFLQLNPGRYILTQGIDTNHDGNIESVTLTENLNVGKRNFAWPVACAPRKEELLVVKQVAASDKPEAAVCDLAVARSELHIFRKSPSEIEVTLPVHNIGTLGAANVLVELQSVGSETKVAARATITKIEAPLDMLPKIAQVSFTIPVAKGQYTIRVSLPAGGQEITDVNNSVSFSL